MADSPRPASSFAVVAHPFQGAKQLCCAYELASPACRNALVFIGGLGDGPHTVPYIRTVAGHLASSAADLSYSVFEVRMSSSFSAFGYSRLEDDVNDLGCLVDYLRGIGKEKVVFMGHSTGCQDCMAYAGKSYSQPSTKAVDGFILQAPVSDREAIGTQIRQSILQESLAKAADMIRTGLADEIMPKKMLDRLPFSTVMTAYRWHSLFAPGGDDDYFSADLSDEVLSSFWGKFSKPVLIVPSGEDEHVPETTDMDDNIDRWSSFCRPGLASGLSDLIPGATHAVREHDSQLWLADRVARFLASLES